MMNKYITIGDAFIICNVLYCDILQFTCQQQLL